MKLGRSDTMSVLRCDASVDAMSVLRCDADLRPSLRCDVDLSPIASLKAKSSIAGQLQTTFARDIPQLAWCRICPFELDSWDAIRFSLKKWIKSHLTRIRCLNHQIVKASQSADFFWRLWLCRLTLLQVLMAVVKHMQKFEDVSRPKSVCCG